MMLMFDWLIHDWPIIHSRLTFQSHMESSHTFKASDWFALIKSKKQKKELLDETTKQDRRQINRSNHSHQNSNEANLSLYFFSNANVNLNNRSTIVSVVMGFQLYSRLHCYSSCSVEFLSFLFLHTTLTTIDYKYVPTTQDSSSFATTKKIKAITSCPVQNEKLLIAHSLVAHRKRYWRIMKPSSW